MRDFGKALKEINFELNKMLLFDVFLNTTLILLVLYFFLSFMNLPKVYALAAFAYFAIASFAKARKRKTINIEQKFGFLKEKLRTAEDNITIKNPVVDELQQEIISDLKKVDESAFISGKKTYIKSAAIVALCFIIIIFAPFHMPARTSQGQESALQETAGNGEGGEASGGILSKEKETKAGVVPSPGNIYGEESVAKIGNRELKVMIQPAGQELNIRNTEEIAEIGFLESYPEEIEATAAESYEEKIPKEHAELVKAYFKAIVEG